MIHHAGIGIFDYQKAKEFYTKALDPLGYTLYMDMAEYGAGGFKDDSDTSFWIGKQNNPQGSHIAFRANSKEAVDAFYAAALAAGGKDNGGPGYRTDYSPSYYAAFVYDFDGNNIEAVWFDPSKEK